MNPTDFSRSLQGQRQHYVGSFFLINTFPRVSGSYMNSFLRASGSYSQICYYSRRLPLSMQGTVFNRGFRVIQPYR